MVGNVPIAVGFGNGSHAPAGYSSRPIVLGLFAIGYATMAKHITATGAFYGYISHGLGRVVGMGSGAADHDGLHRVRGLADRHLLVLLPEPARSPVRRRRALAGARAAHAAAELHPHLLRREPRRQGARRLPGHRDRHAVARWRSSRAVPRRRPGRLRGQPRRSTPSARSQPAAIAGASAGLGLFFAFWSWVGFESTAMYGEESRDPKRIIPRATHDQRARRRHLLRLHLVDGDRGHRPAAGHRARAESDTASKIFFGPVQQLPTATGPSRCSSSCW